MSQNEESNGEGTLPGVTDEDLAASFEVPAVFANRFVVTLTQSGTRISFAEVPVGGKPKFRTAVLLGYHDALELSALLDVMIKKNVVFSEAPEPTEGGEKIDEK